MKNDPYSQLGGLDQQLFQPSQRKEPARQRDNEPALSPTREVTTVSSKHRANEATPQRNNEGSSQRSNVPLKQRANEATRTRVSSPSGHASARIAERHSHDVYLDQVRWINRVKVDIEEMHGAKVTGNQLVQLAIDLIRSDYERNGDDSALVRTLVKGQPPEAENRRHSEPEGG